ncbi:paraquat-inducible protein B [Arboricoccus pini]|uniref:Paraquat-inducible protein B n=1 Tax=Arboricoccus pini TaxID=1963835 RepID=A0A212QUE3_9PROT|nr:MlaD family protein [Arboricoccus pini]SNB63269.1 paraquat-inducible protein B [Arboricoccus pini]
MSDTSTGGSEPQGPADRRAHRRNRRDDPFKGVAKPIGLRPRRSISPVWIVPIVAAIAAGWIAWTTYANQGQLIRIEFQSAQGVEAGKTKIRFKDIDVGTVESTDLSDDLSHIILSARMARNAAPFLTDRAQFWVVRPQITASGVTGLGTLVSGSYIEVDTPGGGARKLDFVGLEEPPAIRSDVPGKAFRLRSADQGSVARGAPVYFKGVAVGQVANSELDPKSRDVVTQVFVNAPYDQLVRSGSHFWNVGGLRLSTGGSGLSFEVPPLQAMIVGGIAFDSPQDANNEAEAKGGTEFRLYSSENAVQEDDGGERVRYLVYFNSSVKGLQRGSSVDFRGIRVGQVVDVRLTWNPKTMKAAIPVMIEIEPNRLVIEGDQPHDGLSPFSAMQRLVEQGLRAQLQTANLLTGELAISLDFFPSEPSAKVEMHDDIPVIPAVPSQLDQLTGSISGVLSQISKLPLAQIGQELQATLQSTRQTIDGVNKITNGPQVAHSLTALQGSLTNLQALSNTLGSEMPKLLATLQQAANSASSTLGKASSTLGPDSRLQYQLTDTLDQLSQTARAVRNFVDYLDRNPEALIQGRQGTR